MKCPRCNSDNCLADEKNKITMFFCVDCGYRTQSDYTIKNLLFQPTLIQMSKDDRHMLWKDPESGLYWFPCSFEEPNGVLYPSGIEPNVVWTYMPMKSVPDEERVRYGGASTIPDETKKKVYDKETLKEALKILKIIE